MKIYDEFFSVIQKLNEAEIPFAVIGGIALSFHTQPRYTKDIDLLILNHETNKCKNMLRSIGYEFEAPSWKFRNAEITMHRLTKIEGEESLTIDLLAGEGKKYKNIIDNALSEDTEFGRVHIAGREDLIWLKQLRNSKQDIADIEALKNDKDSEST